MKSSKKNIKALLNKLIDNKSRNEERRLELINRQRNEVDINTM